MKISVITLLLYFSLCITISAQDSLKIRELKEVEVNAKREWFEGDKAVFVPSRKEKEVVSNAEDLIRIMNLPFCQDVNGSLQSLSGEKIVYFINGVRANEVDLASFWPKEVKRVEYYEKPTDPTFEGCTVAINFIMPQYSMGGVVKLEETQAFPSFGQYRASAKAERKKMSYGILFNSNYSREHGDHFCGEEIYRNIHFDNNFYDILSNKQEQHIIDRLQFVSGAVNARYSTERFRVTHTFLYMWIQNPGSRVNSLDTWSPAIFNSECSKSESRERSSTPTISGEYYVKTSEKSALTARWAYSYGHNNNEQTSKLAELPTILNSTKDNTHSLTYELQEQISFRPNLSSQLLLNGDFNQYRTRYYGSTDTVTNQQHGKLTARWRLSWNPIPKLRIMLMPGMLYEHMKSRNNHARNHFNITGAANITFTPVSTIQINAQWSYTSFNREPSQMADVILQKNSLTWVKGNPSLRVPRVIGGSVQASWMPSNNFSLTPIVSYARLQNGIFSMYTSAPESMGGVIETFENAGRFEEFRSIISLRVRLMNGALSLVGQPTLTTTRYQRVKGSFTNYLSYALLAQCHFDRIFLRLTYSSPKKQLSDGGLSTNRTESYLDFSANYGNGDWVVSLSAENLTNKYSKKSINYDCGAFARITDEYRRGRRLSLTVTYTFGFGKRVDRDIDIDTPASTSSGSLRF